MGNMGPAANQGATPFREPPTESQAIEVATGILWLRFPLPFLLDHVNIYLIEDTDGWAMLDTGINDDRTRQIWRAAFAGPLRGFRLSRIILTHHHPDHMGLAGWLSQQHQVPIYMTLTEFLMGKYLGSGDNATRGDFYRDFYRRHGLADQQVHDLIARGHSYLEAVSPLPDTFQTLSPRTPLVIGGRTFRVLAGGGHSPEQAMLWCEADNIFFSADQVLERISPNISVHATEPDANPLEGFIESLGEIQDIIRPDALTLPGHRLPMRFPVRRAGELIQHHLERCERIEQIVGDRTMSVAEISPRLFVRAMDAHQATFAFSETLAHVNFMAARGQLRWTGDRDLRLQLA